MSGYDETAFLGGALVTEACEHLQSADRLLAFRLREEHRPLIRIIMAELSSTGRRSTPEAAVAECLDLAALVLVGKLDIREPEPEREPGQATR